MMYEKQALRGLPYVSTHLEYIPVRHDPGRGVSVPNVPDSALERTGEYGPLTTRVLAAQDFFAWVAVFAAVCLTLMVVV